MPKKEGKKKEFRVFLDPPIAKEVTKKVEEGIYASPSEALRDIIRDWYKDIQKQGGENYENR